MGASGVAALLTRGPHTYGGKRLHEHASNEEEGLSEYKPLRNRIRCVRRQQAQALEVLRVDDVDEVVVTRGIIRRAERHPILSLVVALPPVRSHMHVR